MLLLLKIHDEMLKCKLNFTHIPYLTFKKGLLTGAYSVGGQVIVLIGFVEIITLIVSRGQGLHYSMVLLPSLVSWQQVMRQ